MAGTASMNLVPSLGEARSLARSYDVVPLYTEFIGDLETPISRAPSRPRGSDATPS
jgi:anthranilate synthase component 1